MLIVDEVHNCAPAGAGGRYARDTLRTKAIRTLAPHCEHRLFLSATPHNGYENSFAALLELLDPHRFARGIQPTAGGKARGHGPPAEAGPRQRRRHAAVREARDVVMLEVDHPDDEREVHADLVAYGVARAARLAKDGETARKTAADFVMTLLKKRLFSSPAAFVRTLEVHRRTLLRERRPAAPPTVGVLRRLIDDAQTAIDEESDEDGVGAATLEAIEAATVSEDTQADPRGARAAGPHAGLGGAGGGHRGRRTRGCSTGSSATSRPDERVIVFSEYRATQRYLQERLAARGIAGQRVELLDGTTPADERERIKNQWQEPPADYPVRVLLATDAASEGISLQKHCHLLAHAEIPWNPNRLEQRNGRVDRHGQTATEVLVHHCVSAGWETGGRGSLEGDLDFLARVVQKVDQIREDLGSAGPVIAAQIEEAMLGRRTTLDETRFSGAAASRAIVTQERRMRERLAELRDELAGARQTLHLHPDRVERVVATALQLARQPALIPATEAGTWTVPPLTGSWVDATIGLEHPARPEQQRPITFDHDIARGRTDVVLAHLGHPLVQMALALLRAEVWGTANHLHRVTMRYAAPALARPSRSRTAGSSSPARPATASTSS